MRKIVAGMFASLDGVVESPEKFSSAYFSPQIMKSLHSRQAAGDTLLLGRVTYEGFAHAFAGQSGGPADWMNATPKYVVSSTLEKADWEGTTLISDNVAEQITALKEQPGKNIIMSGSGSLVQWLLTEKLLDELHLTVYPILVGSGKHLFEGADAPLGLELVDSEAFDNGVLSLRYKAV